MKGEEMWMLLFCCSQCNAKTYVSNSTSSWVTARSTATTPGHCDIGLERRRGHVKAKCGGALCVVNQQEAQSSWHIKRRSYVLSSL